jgi:hypothetical protein
VKGQQTDTHAAVLPDTVTLAVLMAPLTVPGSPDPVSPDVPYQSPSWKPEFAVATRATAPSATHTACEALLVAVPPATATEHQLSKLSTVNATGVAPLQVDPLSPEALLLELLLLDVVVLLLTAELLALPLADAELE